MRKRPKLSRWVTLFTAMTLVAAACGSGDEATTGDDATTDTAADTTTTTAADDATTTEAEPTVCQATIGFVGPITGPVAFIGEVQLNWFKYAIDTLNTEMGYQLEFVEADNQFDTAQSATVAAQFVDNAAMVACLAAYRHEAGLHDDLTLDGQANLIG